MSEPNDEILEAEGPVSRGTELQSAILHVLDGRKHNIVLSEVTLDLEDKEITRYVKRYVNRCKNDMRAKPGEFNEDSEFAQLLGKYFRHEMTLAEFSGEAVKGLIRYFEEEEARSFECIAVDYRIDDVPYLAMILLEEAETILSVTDAASGRIANTIRFHGTSLPPTSKPVASFAVVNMINNELFFVDQGKWKDDYPLIQERLLGASAGMSRREVVNAVREIACEVAETCEENPTVLLSRVKNYISETVEEGMPLNTDQMIEEVFEAEPVIQKTFREKTEEKALPKETSLPKTAVMPSLRKQRLATDTGIEITIPAAYVSNRDYIEFITHSDGSITIEIKQVGTISNKL